MNIDNLIEEIDSDSDKVVFELCKYISDTISENSVVRANKVHSMDEEIFEDVIDKYSFLITIFKTKKAVTGRALATFTGEIDDDTTRILISIIELKTDFRKKVMNNKINKLSNKYTQLLEDGFSYHFSESEVSLIQKLINELREEIASSESFEEEHKARLLKRLEKLQSELHKKMSDLDKFWGLVGDAGVALGKFGKDAKPIVDRIRDLTDIIWGAQRRAEQLPDSSSHPLLEPDEVG